jgi:hypothetical protein
LLFAHCWARNMAFTFMEGKEKREFISSTRATRPKPNGAKKRSMVDSEFCIWNFAPGHLGIIASLPFTCCCHFQLSDSVSLNAPPLKMARTAETVLENTVQETESTVNSSIPLLYSQFANAST